MDNSIVDKFKIGESIAYECETTKYYGKVSYLNKNSNYPIYIELDNGGIVRISFFNLKYLKKYCLLETE